MSKTSKLPRGISLSARGGYRVRVTFGGRQVQVGEFDRLEHARATLDIARGDIARGSFIPPLTLRAQRAAEKVVQEARTLTVAQWSEQWLRELEACGRAKGTLVSYRSHLDRYLLPAFGGVPLGELGSDQINEFMEGLVSLPSSRGARGSRNGVVDHVGRTFRAMLNSAVRAGAGGLSESPFRYALVDPKAKRAASEDDVASPEEVAALAAAMPGHFSLAVLLAAYCSLRIGEVLGLQRGDFDGLASGDHVVLHVRRQLNSKAGGLTPPKSNSYRSLTVPASLVPVIRSHFEKHVGRGKDAPVFVLPGTSVRASHKQLGSPWEKARDRVKPGFRFHDLRHTGLTLFAQQGATLAELLARGGHSDVSVALRYQHATLQRDRALTAALDAQVLLAA